MPIRRPCSPAITARLVEVNKSLLTTATRIILGGLKLLASRAPEKSGWQGRGCDSRERISSQRLVPPPILPPTDRAPVPVLGAHPKAPAASHSESVSSAAPEAEIARGADERAALP